MGNKSTKQKNNKKNKTVTNKINTNINKKEESGLKEKNPDNKEKKLKNDLNINQIGDIRRYNEVREFEAQDH